MSGVPGENEHVLRVDIPGYDEQEFLAPISWEEFFRHFEQKRLAFEYDEAGRYFRFVARR